MSNLSPHLQFFIHLAKAKTVLARRFDNRLSFNGLGFSDFAILCQLQEAEDGKMRRTDLAERVGLTASGITRLLLPLEKIGVVKRETDSRDGRVSYVAITAAGRRLFNESLERAELLSQDLLPETDEAKLRELAAILIMLGKTIVY